MQTGEVWGGEGAGDNISWVPSENFRPSPAPVRCLTSWPLGRRNRGHFLAAGGASPQAEPLSLAEGRHPAEAWVLVPQPPPRVGGCGPCHLRRPPAAPRGVGVGAAGLLWDPEVCTLERTGGERRGGGRGRGGVLGWRLAVPAPPAPRSPAPRVCLQTADGAGFSPRYPTGIFMLSVQP